MNQSPLKRKLVATAKAINIFMAFLLPIGIVLLQLLIIAVNDAWNIHPTKATYVLIAINVIIGIFALIKAIRRNPSTAYKLMVLQVVVMIVSFSTMHNSITGQ